MQARGTFRPAIDAAPQLASGGPTFCSSAVAGAALRRASASNPRALGYSVSPIGVVDLCAGPMDAMIIDHADAKLTVEIEARGTAIVLADTIRRSADARQNVAYHALQTACIAELI
jgi:hypothetical protein